MQHGSSHRCDKGSKNLVDVRTQQPLGRFTTNQLEFTGTILAYGCATSWSFAHPDHMGVPTGIIRALQFLWTFWFHNHCAISRFIEPCRTWWHQAITWSNVDLPSKVSCGIHMRAISQGMFMNLIHNMCSEFALFKIIATTPRGQGVKSDGGPWGATLQLESSPTGLLWYLLFANQNYIPNLVIWFVLEIRHHPCRFNF